MTHGAGARRAVRGHRPALVGAALAIVLVAGCSSAADETAGPTSSTAPPTASTTATTTTSSTTSTSTSPAPSATSASATSAPATSAPATTVTSGPGPAVDRAIRGVDFRNGFTYAVEGLPPFQVTDGRAAQGTPGTPGATAFLVRDVDYGDLDGDGREEAAVSTLYDGGGTGKFTSVWVYQLTASSIRRAATSPVGDRGEGGVAEVSVADGVLVVDTYDRPQGACCPTALTRHRYRLRSDALVDSTPPTTTALLTLDPSGPPLQFLPGTSGAVLRTAGARTGAATFDAAGGQRLVASSRSTDVTLVLRRGPGASDPMLSQGPGIDVRLPATGTYRIEVLLAADLDVLVDLGIT